MTESLHLVIWDILPIKIVFPPYPCVDEGLNGKSKLVEVPFHIVHLFPLLLCSLAASFCKSCSLTSVHQIVPDNLSNPDQPRSSKIISDQTTLYFSKQDVVEHLPGTRTSSFSLFGIPLSDSALSYHPMWPKEWNMKFWRFQYIHHSQQQYDLGMCSFLPLLLASLLPRLSIGACNQLPLGTHWNKQMTLHLRVWFTHLKSASPVFSTFTLRPSLYSASSLSSQTIWI